MISSTLLNHRYRVIHSLSTGGFSSTCVAEDTQMPSGRRCVIKQLRPIAHRPEMYQMIQERFQREAAILEELGDRCPQIPQLYAYFLEDEKFYLVQEWIEGQTLNQKVQNEGPLSEAFVVQCLTHLLAVLDYIHSQHIIHRDIKPSNIIVRYRDGKPVLIDFGAVKEIMVTISDYHNYTTKSIAIGTPGFMPPEQAAGKPVFASDLYSLGLTAIYLLTGKFPHDLETNLETGEIQWQRYAPHISANLTQVLTHATQSHPRDRYPTAQAMLAALHPTDAPVLADTIPNFPPAHFSPTMAPTVAPPSQAIEAYSTANQQATATAMPAVKWLSRWPVWPKAAAITALLVSSITVGLMLPRPEQRVTVSYSRQSIAPSVPPLAAHPDTLPRRLSFSLGATGAIVRDKVLPGQSKRYLLECKQFQELTIKVLEGEVNVQVIGPDHRSLETMTKANKSWYQLLPTTGDYQIEITSTAGSSFAVSVEVI